MSDLYGPAHRLLQEEHGTRRLADRLESMAHAEFDPRDQEFIAGVAMFFLATVDAHGRPTVSYKGGAPGFVRIVSPNQLVFPIYDGNGMFLSMGNIATTSQVGLLFIDFAEPRRLRVQGSARVRSDPALLSQYAGAQHLIEVTASHIFVNCGRYIHNLSENLLSPHIPDPDGRQPFPNWKRIQGLAETLSDSDQARVAQAGGSIPIEEYPGEACAAERRGKD